MIACCMLFQAVMTLLCFGIAETPSTAGLSNVHLTHWQAAMLVRLLHPVLFDLADICRNKLSAAMAKQWHIAMLPDQSATFAYGAVRAFTGLHTHIRMPCICINSMQVVAAVGSISYMRHLQFYCMNLAVQLQWDQDRNFPEMECGRIRQQTRYVAAMMLHEVLII